jgi:hypothetical protein
VRICQALPTLRVWAFIRSRRAPPRAIAAEVDPRFLSRDPAALPSGSTILVRVKVPGGAVVSDVHVLLLRLGDDLSTAFPGVYEADGAQAGVTPSQTKAWGNPGSIGTARMALAKPIPAQQHDRDVYLALFATGETAPQFGYSGALRVRVS